jgi:hypothetical protein
MRLCEVPSVGVGVIDGREKLSTWAFFFIKIGVQPFSLP